MISDDDEDDDEDDDDVLKNVLELVLLVSGG